MDITGEDEFGRAWDFNKVEMRNHAYRRLVKEKPYLLVGSPVCTPWSTAMNRNWWRMTEQHVAQVMEEARRHLEFVCKLYRMQHQSGRYYLHEHPYSATSWREMHSGNPGTNMCASTRDRSMPVRAHHARNGWSTSTSEEKNGDDDELSGNGGDS